MDNTKVLNALAEFVLKKKRLPPHTFVVHGVDKKLVDALMKEYGYWHSLYDESLYDGNNAANYVWGAGEREALLDLLQRQRASAQTAFDIMNFDLDEQDALIPSAIHENENGDYMATFLPYTVILSTGSKSMAGGLRSRKKTKRKTRKTRRKTHKSRRKSRKSRRRTHK